MTGIVEVCVRWCATYADKKMVEPMTETIRQLTAKAEGPQVRAESSHLLEEARRQRDEAQMEMAALQRRLLALEQANAKQAGEILELRAAKGGGGGKSPSSNWQKKR
jgi:protein subunit release factor A